MKDEYVRGEKYQGLIEVGQRIHSILYGGKDGVVWHINGDQDPGSIKSLGGGCVVMGGQATFDIVFEDHISRALPESILRGVQWYIDTSGDRAGKEEIDAMLLEVGRITKEKEEKKAKEAEARAKERAELPGKYPFLIPVANSGKSSHAMGAKNLKTELERSFPGVKFSVKSQTFSGGDSIHFGWTDGPLQKEAEEIGDKYQEGHFDGMNDLYEYSRDNIFPSIFGGAKYVSGSRHESKELTMMAAKELGFDLALDAFDQWGNMKDGGLSYEDQQRIYRQAREMRGPMLEAKEETKASGNGAITIRRNEAKDGIEVIFPAKPEKSVIDSLKSYGFRWSPGQGLWYCRYNEAKLRSVQSLLS